jgi:hypothetical protein
MRMRLPVLASIAVCACIATASPRAPAFGGTAKNLEHKGNFAITNNAGFEFTQQLTNPTDTTFVLRPALDYFVIDHLSLGGAVEFRDIAPQRGRSQTTFTIAPDVGFAVGISDTWSFWLIGSVPFAFPNPGNPVVALDIFAAFLIHPADHFFFGIGPTFTQVLTQNQPTSIGGRFVIGGYFDH